MTKQITTLQAMRHPDVVATINVLSETTQRLQDEIDELKAALAQPEQEAQYEYLIDDLAEWKQYVEVDSAPYGLREHVTKVLLAHGIKEKNT